MTDIVEIVAASSKPCKLGFIRQERRETMSSKGTETAEGD